MSRTIAHSENLPRSKPTTRTNSNREPLGNITNNGVQLSNNFNKPIKSTSHTFKVVKAPKRTLESGEEKIKVKDSRNKRKKSDPMDITEEIKCDDIDAADFSDPQSVAAYVNDIYSYLMEKEKDYLSSQYMIHQVDINEKMRGILIDWLVEVHRMFKLLPETLFLTVNIIDRYLERKSISRDKLQLVGITSMLLASKFEEIYAPECGDFVYISDGAYTKEQILKMEQNILNTLNFNLTSPSSLHFLRRYSKAAASDYQIHTLCKYFLEIVLIDIKFLKYTPSQIAASSVYLARIMTQTSPLWTPALNHYTTYSESDVRACALEINELLKKSQTSNLKAIRKKYENPRNGQVSLLPLVDII